MDGVHLQQVSSLLEWSNDDSAVFASLVPDGARPLPEPARTPEGPSVRTGAGRATPQRTAREVLRSPDDQARFAFTVTTQLARVPADGGAVQPLGAPVALAGCDVSPDEKWLLVSRFTLPAPLGFPADLFATTVELWPAAGGAAIAVAQVPLNDRSAIASVSPLGMRDFSWAPDGKSLWCASWEDTPGASPQAALRDTSLPPPGRDRIMRLDAPFTAPAVEVASTAFPLYGFAFTSDGARVVMYEGYEPRRVERESWLLVKNPAERGVVSYRSSEGAYDAPGRPVMATRGHNRTVRVTADGKSYFRLGDGYGPAGQRPFLDRCAFDAPQAAAVGAPGAAQAPVSLLDDEGRRFITLSQTTTEPPNWFVRRTGDKTARGITAFANPALALSKAQRKQFKFKRDDGVELNADVLLPADWHPGSAPLPTVFWIYPNDYRSAAAASENRTSANRFPSQSPLNPEVLVTQGYAVVRPDLSIVGSNDQYVTELRRSAEAAVAECVRRGYTDRDRVGVGGHSYGAFSTVNCLAHTRLFRAGIASDGAYNRTLTPFTFQAETRNLWEAPDTYLQMSPFLHADQIEAPLLLLHNQDDTNVGTHPMQSQRLYEAMNGLGKTVQLVEYPFEDHGPAARETVLDYWARAIEWLDRYVKNAGPAAPAPRPAP
jgi:dipeptidyl aminopeptidase/acylaminoacyl peptidase